MMSAFLVGKRLECIPISVSYNRIVSRCFLGYDDIGCLAIKEGWTKEDKEYSGGYYKFSKDETKTYIYLEEGSFDKMPFSYTPMINNLMDFEED